MQAELALGVPLVPVENIYVGFQRTVYRKSTMTSSYNHVVWMVLIRGCSLHVISLIHRCLHISLIILSNSKLVGHTVLVMGGSS